MKKGLENLDPIKITISEDLYRLLAQDAQNFEYYDYKTGKFVVNRFVSSLITGYFPLYRRKISGQYKEMKSLLNSFIEDSAKMDSAISRLICSKALGEDGKLDRGKTRTIHIRPNSENDGTISAINDSMMETDETQAGYYRRMFESYCGLPMYEREKVIYYSVAEKLEKACDKRKEITISVISEKGIAHYDVIPYRLVPGQDERFNYLICQKYSEKENKPAAATYRLSRITMASETGSEEKITPEVARYLRRMEECGPQHAINDDGEVLVELNGDGLASFRAIYHDRPRYESVETGENGKTVCRFRCSQNQLYLYFRRFNPGEARILNSPTLNQRLYDFHKENVENLQKQLQEEAPELKR